jgi:hypothetical protein
MFIWARYRYLSGSLLVASCTRLTAPPLPSGAVAFIAPQVYTTWWKITEACSGIHAEMSTISWYVVPNTGVLPFGSLPDVQGYWSSSGNRIVLAGNYARDGGTVRHEMLHALLRNGRHVRSQFLGACGGIVDCGQGCIADAGPAYVDPDAARVTADDLDLSFTVNPIPPSEAVDSGFLRVTVSATNVAPVPVIVTLPPRGDPIKPGPPTTFSYYLFGSSGGLSGGELALDSGATRFGPHEAKQQVFDFVIGDSIVLAGQPAGTPRSVPPGSYLVRASYGGHSVSDTVRIGP